MQARLAAGKRSGDSDSPSMRAGATVRRGKRACETPGKRACETPGKRGTRLRAVPLITYVVTGTMDASAPLNGLFSRLGREDHGRGCSCPGGLILKDDFTVNLSFFPNGSGKLHLHHKGPGTDTAQ